MAVIVTIPAALQKLTRQQSEIHAEGGTVQAVLADLERCFPGMQAQLCDDQGAIRHQPPRRRLPPALVVRNYWISLL